MNDNQIVTFYVVILSEKNYKYIHAVCGRSVRIVLTSDQWMLIPKLYWRWWTVDFVRCLLFKNNKNFENRINSYFRGKCWGSIYWVRSDIRSYWPSLKKACDKHAHMHLRTGFVGKFLTWWVVRFSSWRLNRHARKQNYPVFSSRAGPRACLDTAKHREDFVPSEKQTSIPRWSSLYSNEGTNWILEVRANLILKLVRKGCRWASQMLEKVFCMP